MGENDNYYGNGNCEENTRNYNDSDDCAGEYSSD